MDYLDIHGGYQDAVQNIVSYKYLLYPRLDSIMTKLLLCTSSNNSNSITGTRKIS